MAKRYKYPEHRADVRMAALEKAGPPKVEDVVGLSEALAQKASINDESVVVTATAPTEDPKEGLSQPKQG